MNAVRYLFVQIPLLVDFSKGSFYQAPPASAQLGNNYRAKRKKTGRSFSQYLHHQDLAQTDLMHKLIAGVSAIIGHPHVNVVHELWTEMREYQFLAVY